MATTVDSRRETASLIGSDKMEGTAVYGADDRKIGTVQRAMIDKISGTTSSSPPKQDYSPCPATYTPTPYPQNPDSPLPIPSPPPPPPPPTSPSYPHSSPPSTISTPRPPLPPPASPNPSPSLLLLHP